METFPIPIPATIQTIISSYGNFGLGPSLTALNAPTPVSQTWTSANEALFTPISIPIDFLVGTIGCLNGAVASGNLDLGIYAANGNRLISTGSTAQVGTNTPQEITISPVRLRPNTIYWLALVFDNIVGTVLATQISPVALNQTLGHFRATAQFPLPRRITVAESITRNPPQIHLLGTPNA